MNVEYKKNGKRGVAHKIGKFVYAAVIVSSLAAGTMSGCSSVKVVGGNSDPTMNSNVNINAVADSQDRYEWSEWDENDAPNYYKVEGEAVERYDIPADGKAHYSELDSLGRATWGAIMITPDVWEKESNEGRESDKLPDPAGYKGNNAEVDVELCNGDTYHGWFYNRSHLIADSLGGDPIKQNLVTCTRMQNVGSNNQGGSGFGGMSFAEDMVRKYMENNPSATVYYSATPVYNDNDLLPRSVFVDVKSDDGKLNQHIEVFNAQKGYVINYLDGTWQKIE